MPDQEETRNPFLGVPPESALDPASPNFSPRVWFSNLAGYISKNSAHFQNRNAGVSFKGLEVYSFSGLTNYQKTVGNIWLGFFNVCRLLVGEHRQRIQILREFNGLVRAGEMCLVLGRPGSGCSTLLKTISGDTHGFFVGADSKINYQGIPPSQMHQQFRGEAIYMAETDVHFQQLTVGQTL